MYTSDIQELNFPMTPSLKLSFKRVFCLYPQPNHVPSSLFWGTEASFISLISAMNGHYITHNAPHIKNTSRSIKHFKVLIFFGHSCFDIDFLNNITNQVGKYTINPMVFMKKQWSSYIFPDWRIQVCTRYQYHNTIMKWWNCQTNKWKYTGFSQNKKQPHLH